MAGGEVPAGIHNDDSKIKEFYIHGFFESFVFVLLPSCGACALFFGTRDKVEKPGPLFVQFVFLRLGRADLCAHYDLFHCFRLRQWFVTPKISRQSKKAKNGGDLVGGDQSGHLGLL